MSLAFSRVLSDALRRVLGAVGPGVLAYQDPREAHLLSSAASMTPEQTLIAHALADAGHLRVDALVDLVSTALYREELREGAGAADISLLGPRIFVPDVLRALEEGDGRLWRLSTATPTS